MSTSHPFGPDGPPDSGRAAGTAFQPNSRTPKTGRPARGDA